MGYTREELPIHTKSTSLFNHLETMPGDPIFGLMSLYAKDPAEKKASLTIGVYRDEEGKPWVLPTVKKVRICLFLIVLLFCSFYIFSRFVFISLSFGCISLSLDIFKEERRK